MFTSNIRIVAKQYAFNAHRITITGLVQEDIGEGVYEDPSNSIYQRTPSVCLEIEKLIG